MIDVCGPDSSDAEGEDEDAAKAGAVILHRLPPVRFFFFFAWDRLFFFFWGPGMGWEEWRSEEEEASWEKERNGREGRKRRVNSEG